MTRLCFAIWSVAGRADVVCACIFVIFYHSMMHVMYLKVTLICWCQVENVATIIIIISS